MEVEFVINVEYDERFSNLHFSLRLVGVNRIIYNRARTPDRICSIILAGVLCFNGKYNNMYFPLIGIMQKNGSAIPYENF